MRTALIDTIGLCLGVIMVLNGVGVHPGVIGAIGIGILSAVVSGWVDDRRTR